MVSSSSNSVKKSLNTVLKSFTAKKPYRDTSFGDATSIDGSANGSDYVESRDGVPSEERFGPDGERIKNKKSPFNAIMKKIRSKRIRKKVDSDGEVQYVEETFTLMECPTLTEYPEGVQPVEYVANPDGNVILGIDDEPLNLVLNSRDIINFEDQMNLSTMEALAPIVETPSERTDMSDARPEMEPASAQIEETLEPVTEAPKEDESVGNSIAQSAGRLNFDEQLGGDEASESSAHKSQHSRHSDTHLVEPDEASTESAKSGKSAKSAKSASSVKSFEMKLDNVLDQVLAEDLSRDGERVTLKTDSDNEGDLEQKDSVDDKSSDSKNEKSTKDQASTGSFSSEVPGDDRYEPPAIKPKHETVSHQIVADKKYMETVESTPEPSTGFLCGCI